MTATSIVVLPEALLTPADLCDRAGSELAAVARELARLAAWTGRADSTAAVAAAAEALSRLVAVRAAAAHGVATGLRAAARGYAAAERRASGF